MSSKKLSVRDLMEYIKLYVNTNAIGVMDILDIYAKMRYGSDALTLLFNDTGRFLELLDYVYGSRGTSILVLKLFFIKPLLEKLGMLDKLDEIVSMISSNPSAFKELLRSMGVEY